MRLLVQADLRAQLVDQAVELGAQVLTGGDLADRDPQRGQLPGQVLGVGLRGERPLPVLLQRDPVPVGLAVLGQQDQRRRVGGLRREREVQQDERDRGPTSGTGRAN